MVREPFRQRPATLWWRSSLVEGTRSSATLHSGLFMADCAAVPEEGAPAGFCRFLVSRPGRMAF